MAGLVASPLVFEAPSVPDGFLPPQPAPLIPVYASWLTIMLVLSLGILLHASFKHSDPLKRVQSQYILAGAAISLILPMFFNFYMVNFQQTHDYYPIGMISQTALVVFAGYAMTRYRFLSVRVVFRKAIVYGLAMSVYLGLVVGLSAAAVVQYQVRGGLGISLFIGFLALILLYLFGLYSRKVKKFLDGIFFREDMQFATIVEEGKRAFSSTHELETFILELVSRVQSLVDAPVVELLVRQDFRRRYAAFSPKKSRMSVGFDEPLAKEFQELTGVFLGEELEHAGGAKYILKMMKRRKANIYWCVADEDGPLVVIFIGRHKADMPYKKSALAALDELGGSVITKVPTFLHWQKAIESGKVSWRFR